MRKNFSILQNLLSYDKTEIADHYSLICTEMWLDETQDFISIQEFTYLVLIAVCS